MLISIDFRGKRGHEGHSAGPLRNDSFRASRSQSQRITSSRRKFLLDHLVDPPKTNGLPSTLCQTIDKSVSDTVTEPSDESLDPKPEAVPASPISGEAATTDLASTAEVPAAEPLADTPAGPVGEDGLPEWEPLTPELVEDEAIRGDFVIRWVVVGLALLLGISQISETRTLVHLKNGEYLLSHGILPGAKDVFSHTANDRTWVNLSWLFDIASAGTYLVSGGIGLSIFQGLLAGLTFGLVCHAVRPNIRTWWGSICSALALLVCYPQFTVQPELVTLLGLGFVLWTLIRSEEPGQSQRLWMLVPALWLWAQFDPHAWFGWFLLLLWAAGEWLSGEIPALREKSPLGKVALASLLVVTVHPFLWEAWLAPVRMYLTEYPAIRYAYQGSSFADLNYFPLWKPLFWSSLNHRTIAALVLFLATLTTMWLNRARVSWSHVYALIGFNSLSLFATHELAAASLVNCVLCTIHAQTWFRERTGQVYSIDWRFLLFSRGGRAVTVLTFFTLAWLILSGRLDGPGGKRTGIGFESQMASAMDTYREMNSDLVDDHPFNFSMRQGDLMIWGGLKPFVDSRAGLFFGNADNNLLELHNKTRRALRRKRESIEGSGDPGIWKATFDKYQIHQAWPRLNGTVPPPDYPTLSDLMASSDFVLNKLNAATAVFLRNDPADETTKAYRDGHPFDFLQQAFRTKLAKPDDLTREWSKPATAYDNMFSLRRPIVPGGVQAAQHFLELATSREGMPKSQAFACALLAIRHANEGLRDEPNSATGYHVLGRSYSILGQLESLILKQGGAPSTTNQIRYLQSVTALQQAVSLQPDDINAILKLIDQYQSMGRLDIQLDLFKKLNLLIPYSKSMSAQQRDERAMIFNEVVRLEELVADIDSKISHALEEGVERTQVAMGAYQLGGLLRAIKTLEDDAIYLEKNPQSKLLLGNWLHEAGRGRDAASILESLEGLATDNGLPGWKESAAISSLTVANYLRAIKLWSDKLDETSATLIPSTLYSLPFLTLNPLWAPDSYPMTHVGTTAQLLRGVRLEGSALLYSIAQAQLEAGMVDEATNSIRQALQLYPSSSLRPILALYLECLTGEQVPATSPESSIEELTDLADSESEKTESK